MHYKWLFSLCSVLFLSEHGASICGPGPAVSLPLAMTLTIDSRDRRFPILYIKSIFAGDSAFLRAQV